MFETIGVNCREYTVLKLLGHGKGGYSYLAESEGKQVVLKQIHHEPCSYYTFGNKIEAEERDYQRLKDAGIRIPAMLEIDREAERIVKEYIPGLTIFELLKNHQPVEAYFPQVREMAAQAKRVGLNIDFFPTNFVVCQELLYYIDYECNPFMEKWSFENWGILYWSRTKEFEAYLQENGCG